MAEHNYRATVKILGIPDRIIEHGSPKELYNEIGIDAGHIADAIRSMSKIEVDKITAV
jgi:1-deoxy-D-xylulose-5-phosphate synthase